MPEKHTCTACGFPIETEQTTCPNCGLEVEATPAVAAEKSAVAPGRVSVKAISASNVVFIAAALLFTVLVIVIYTENDAIMDHANHDHGQEHQHTNQAPAVDPAEIERREAFVRANPGDADGLLKLANILHDAGRPLDAIHRYEEYLTLNPSDPDARIDMGVCYFELQRYDEAIREMTSALSEHPKHQLGSFNLGVVYLNKGDNTKAKEWFGRAQAIDPDSPTGRNAATVLQQIAQQ